MTLEIDAPGAGAPAGSVFAGGRSIRGVLLRMAWPVMAERASLSVLAMVDALLVGRYVGADGVAAVGIGALLLWVPLVGAVGAETGATALVARDIGSGSRRTTERSIQAAVTVALVWGIAAALLTALPAALLMRLMGAEGDVGPLGARYLRFAAAGLPPLLVMYAANGALRGLGNTVRPMLVLLAVNAVNLAVTFLLISDVVGIALGVEASGIGYACSGITGGVLALAGIARGHGGFRFRLSAGVLRPGRQAVRRFMTLALPVALEELQFIGAFLVYTRIIAVAGTDAVAAHTIALRTLDLAIVPGFALGIATTALVGQAMGMERADLAEAVVRAARRLGLVVMTGAAVVLAAASPWAARLFIDDEGVVRTAATLLRIFALGLPAIGLHATLAGALRGAGDVRYPLGVTSVATWLVRIPAAWVFAVLFGWGAPGAWIGAVLDNLVRATLIIARFATDRWKRFSV
jgi:putative MATE family efflux protein